MTISNEGKRFTVREAARVTNYSVPYFYSDTGRERLGVPRGSTTKGWLIPESLLIECGMLTPDGKPIKKPTRTANDELSADVSELQAEISELSQQIKSLEEDLYKEVLSKTKLEAEVAQKDEQIKMLREMFVQISG